MEMCRLSCSKLLESLTCPSCKQLLRYPVTLSCGHNLCQPCAEWIRDQGGNTLHTSCCPDCGSPTEPGTYIPNEALRKAVVHARVLRDVLLKGAGSDKVCPKEKPFPDNMHHQPSVALSGTPRLPKVRDVGDTQSERSIASSCSIASADPPPDMTLPPAPKSKVPKRHLETGVAEDSGVEDLFSECSSVSSGSGGITKPVRFMAPREISESNPGTNLKPERFSTQAPSDREHRQKKRRVLT